MRAGLEEASAGDPVQGQAASDEDETDQAALRAALERENSSFDVLSDPAPADPSLEDTQPMKRVRSKSDSRNALIWNELGNIYFNAGAEDEAISAFQKAINLDGSYGWSYSNLATIYIPKGRYTEAIPLFQKGIDLIDGAKDQALLWNRLGDAYRRLNNHDRAAEAYEKATQLDPSNASLLTRARFSLLGNCKAE